MYFRKIALASVLASGFVLPALAQTASPDVTPPRPRPIQLRQSPMPG